MSLSRAIEWRWPGARCIVRGGTLERWDGPMAQPSAGELTQALTDYTASQVSIEADAKTDAFIDAIDGDLLMSVLEQLPTMQAEITAGTYQSALWKQRIKARVKTLRRSKGA